MINSCLRNLSMLAFALSLSPLALATTDSITIHHWQKLLPQDAHVSVILADENGHRIIDNDSNKLLLPASTQKLFTAVVATKVLGENFQFQTSLLYQGNIEHHQLNGDILLKFDGDPRLSTDELSNLLAEIPKAGIKQINGDIIIVADDQNPKWAPGWLWDDLGVCFAAPVGKLILDQNCVKGALQSQQDKTSKVHLRYPLTIDNSARYEPQTPDALCQLHLSHAQGNQYRLSGCYQLKDPLPLEVAIVDPAAYISEQVKRHFPRSVKYSGQIKVTTANLDNAIPLISHPSLPLKPLIIEMLKKSDNLIADSLLKRIGEVTFGKFGFEFGAAAVKQTLIKLGIQMDSANLVDGSGLSRYNQVNAEQLFELLQLIQRDPQLQWLVKALPVAGLSGTLKFKRGYVNPQLRGVIWAKTGSMTGVDNLAGFIRLVQNDTTRLYPFVIMENGIAASEQHPKKFAPPFLKLVKKQIVQAAKEQQTLNTKPSAERITNEKPLHPTEKASSKASSAQAN